MDGFARQLADLQRAASRAGRDGGGGGRGRDGGRGDGGRRRGNFNGGDGRRGDDRDRKRGRFEGGGRDDGRGDDRRGRDPYCGRDRGRGDGGRLRDRPDPRDRSPPLAALVEGAAQKYAAAQQQEGAAGANNTAGGRKRRRHIALLFVTIDDLPHEHIWREWLRSGSGGPSVGEEKDAAGDQEGEAPNRDDDNVMVSVLCHAKFPERIRSPWLRRRHLLRRQGDGNGKAGGKEGEEGRTDERTAFHSHRPGWGSIEITRAMIDLLEEGLRIGVDEGRGGGGGEWRRYLSTPGDEGEDNAETAADAKPSAPDGATGRAIPPVDRFVFVSESCLPVATLLETELALFGPRPRNNVADDSDDAESKSPPKANPYDKSWVHARSTPNNGYAQQLQWDAIRRTDVPHRLIWKADQWMALTRAHADAVAALPRTCLEGRALWPAFRKVRASDELYFPTALAMLGILRRPGGGEVDDSSRGESCAGDDVRRRRATYCDWSVGAKNPAAFAAGDWRGVAEKARGEGCLFARKFVGEAARPGGMAGTGGGSAGGGLVSVEEWRAAVANRDAVE